MRTLPFGCFRLVDHSLIVGFVAIAPGLVFIQPTAHPVIRDVSYMTVWTHQREEATEGELRSVTQRCEAIVNRATPELWKVLQQIGPGTAAVVVRVGECRTRVRTGLRRCLRTALRYAARISLPDFEHQ